MQIPTDELPRRRPVWEALSDLFLDTELDEASIEHIAKALVASGYTDAELERILWHELCPVLFWNVLSVAGEWEGFKISEIEMRILTTRGGRVMRFASYHFGGRAVEADWQRIKGAIAKRRCV